MKLNTIYNECCLNTLKRLPDNSIDLTITSPPYNMNLRIRNKQYCSRQIIKERTTKYTNFSDNLPIEEYNSFHTNVINELLRVSNLIFYNIQIVLLKSMNPCLNQLKQNYFFLLFFLLRLLSDNSTC